MQYDFLQKISPSFETQENFFGTRDEIKEWIIRNQFGRRNLSNYDRSRLALQLEEVIKKKAKDNQGTRNDIPQLVAESFKPIETREELAKIAGAYIL